MLFTCPTCGSEHQIDLDGNSHVSYGNWDRESDASDFIKDIIQRSGLFTVYNQVNGYILQPRLSCQDKSMRIDFILSPTKKLMEAGWKHGPIGLEIKKSGLKINEPFAQAKDYARTVWCLPTGYKFMCEYYFLFPFHSTHGFMASIMAQERIGTLSHSEYKNTGLFLRFKCGESKTLYYGFSGDIIDIDEVSFGRKTGSR